ncbi:hypothetical protein LJC07_05640 [Christensenellaceae bacterium OttesenSCG-928-L17]|nr:hypothetical protein [Christensenellaceae bacterium OttesenSCG-928-L17]
MNQNAAPLTQEDFHRRMLWQSMLRTFCVCVMALALLLTASYMGGLGRKLDGFLTSLNTLTQSLEEADLPALVEDARVLIEDANGTLISTAEDAGTAMERIHSIDIEQLNKAIRDFAATVEPLARLFGR